jgi:hypothetical protein
LSSVDGFGEIGVGSSRNKELEVACGFFASTVAGGIVGGCNEIEIDRCIDDSELAALCGDGNGCGDVASVSSAGIDSLGDDEAFNLSEDNDEDKSDTQAEEIEHLPLYKVSCK